MSDPQKTIREALEYAAEMSLYSSEWRRYRDALAALKEMGQRSDGAGDIARERDRQISAEGWRPAHDDGHVLSELSRAAVSYAILASKQACCPDVPIDLPARWPWDAKWWKPSADPVRNLEKAGALIAAEIDRLKRKRPAVSIPEPRP